MQFLKLAVSDLETTEIAIRVKLYFFIGNESSAFADSGKIGDYKKEKDQTNLSKSNLLQQDNQLN